jgi:hypothetical protein
VDAPLPEINGRNPSARGFAERTAVNPPLQGTAADLIKFAMVRIDAALQAAGHASAMLLQQRHENRRRRRASRFDEGVQQAALEAESHQPHPSFREHPKY